MQQMETFKQSEDRFQHSTAICRLHVFKLDAECFICSLTGVTSSQVFIKVGSALILLKLKQQAFKRKEKEGGGLTLPSASVCFFKNTL